MDKQMVVRHKKFGTLGIVTSDNFGLCEPGEVMVIYENTSYGIATSIIELETIGPENAAADLKKCGSGLGKKCCKFLVIINGKVSCQRFGALRERLIMTKMVAEREPVEFYPKCQFE